MYALAVTPPTHPLRRILFLLYYLMSLAISTTNLISISIPWISTKEIFLAGTPPPIEEKHFPLFLRRLEITLSPFSG